MSNTPILNFVGLWEKFYNSGVEYFHEGELMKALFFFDTAIALKKDFPEAWNNRGICLLKIGRIQEAFRSINKALRLKPNYKVAMENRLTVLKELKNRKIVISIDSADLVLASNRVQNKPNRDFQLNVP